MHHHVGRSAHVAASTSGSHTLLDRASRVLIARATCTNDSDPGCTKPTQVPTIAIVLAVAVPVVGLMIVLIFLHRRNNRRLAAEDAKDKYKSLDFGMEGAGGMRKGKKGPEMSITEKEIRGGHTRGLSLEGGSPYILPVGLHGSRESFHSLSRSHNDPHDPYRPVTFMTDNQSVRSQSRAYGHDNGSLYTTSSGGTQRNRMNDGLLKNAQRMSTSHPMRGESLSPDGSQSPDLKFPDPAIALSPLNPRYDNEPLPAPLAPPAELPDSRAAPKPDVPIIAVPEPVAREVTKSPVEAPAAPSYPPRIQSQTAVVHQHANTISIISTSSYGDGFQVTPPSPRQSQTTHVAQPQPLRPQPQHDNGLGVDEFGHNTNRLSIMRPLPPDEPDENPAQRAERIRSFYKEYFDDSKPEPAGGHNYTDYYEDYGSEYHQDGAIFDTRSRGFVAAQPNAPFAAPVTRRAMTPPPRAPPRFRSNTQTGPRGPHMSNSSMVSSQYQPRNMSSMSGRLPAPGPRKPLPPPSALSSLPTPAKLSADAMVFNPLDFAPPVSFRERQNGMRPDSPLGSPRPFSPSVRPHTPLASSYDDLAVMPSPHMLRKSGLFTGLDFAPPPRFRDPGSNASDAGSIRSNRSGMSAAGRFAVANGANRVSKIPKEMVFTKDDMMSQLRPKLDMVSKA
ncbi:hypothetical protein EK21DRAFT_106896 [Setomelanomma holmii]|uniref:Uncharacterized protein n=1 Tax=Setomelanomma holmii TaxID=210430 RepID=A0A9P4LT31_9PLEO|nr:hypothetical protein EK21DRAFT_106896 [Setomelanomma holmii]